MNTALAEQLIAANAGESSPIFELLDELLQLLPVGSESTNTWNVISWHDRPGNARTSNIRFEKYQNEELRTAIQLYILHKRYTNDLKGNSAISIANTLLCLDRRIGDRKLQQVTNGDFYAIEKELIHNSTDGVAYRTAGYLASFGKWLNSVLGLRVSYIRQIKSHHYHGRHATDDGREAKLMPTQVIEDLINCLHRENLLDKDKLGISSVAIMTATGFRIGETTTMPANCVISENGAVGILYYPEKGGPPAPSWLMPSITSAVVEAINTIKEATETARAIAREMKDHPAIDWPLVFKNPKALQYFAKKACHEWTSKLQNRLFENKGIWIDKYQQYFDLIGLLEECNGNKSELARKLKAQGTPIVRETIHRLIPYQLSYESGQLPTQTRAQADRVSWDTDSRIISILRFFTMTGMCYRKKYADIISPIIDEARRLQLEGRIYPEPRYDADLEYNFCQRYRPVIVDENNKPVLWPHEALFITLKRQFATRNTAKIDEFLLYSKGMLSRWFSGESRSLGTKNHEDCCWSRLGIIDPKTGEIANYTSHDFRHWLNTQVNEGGLSEDQIALMFGRKDRRQNAVYDQRPLASKIEGLRQAARDGKVLGNIARTYSRLANESREEAEKYLQASTMMVNILPHGICSNNWASNPCPHQLSCLSCTDQNEPNQGPCELLFVSPSDTESKDELQRLKKNAAAALEMIPESSPQREHYLRVQSNAEQLLNELTTGARGKRSKPPIAGKWDSK